MFVSSHFFQSFCADILNWLHFADEMCLYFLKSGLENLSASVADAQTLMSLYFALCTKVSDH